jgi:hypothetical protein
LKSELPELHDQLAYAQASMCALESVLLLLIERRVLLRDDIVEALEDAVATKRQLALDGSHPEISTLAAGLLSGVANSVRAIHLVKNGA